MKLTSSSFTLLKEFEFISSQDWTGNTFIFFFFFFPFFYFLFYFFKFYFIFKLYIIVLVLPNNKMNPPQVYMCSPSWTLLPPPSPFHPSGSFQCTSPKHPVSCIFIFNLQKLILSFWLKTLKPCLLAYNTKWYKMRQF